MRKLFTALSTTKIHSVTKEYKAKMKTGRLKQKLVDLFNWWKIHTFLNNLIVLTQSLSKESLRKDLNPEVSEPGLGQSRKST